MRDDRLFLACGLSILALLSASTARAETLQAPVGGKPIPLGDGRVACAPPAGGWSIAPDGRSLRPPVADTAVGQAVELHVAPDAAGCAASKSAITLVATGAWPALDTSATLLAVDEARLEVRGKKLRGARFTVRTPAHTVEDTCLDPRLDGGTERCALAVGRGLPADPSAVSVDIVPAGGRSGSDVITFDAEGRRAVPADLSISPAKITIGALVPAGVSVDSGAGSRRVALAHPEAVASVTCSGAECDLADGGVSVRGLSAGAGPLTLRFKLLPRVALARGDALDSAPSLNVPVLACPIAVVSGPLLRGVDDARVVVRLGGACARDLRSLRFQVRGLPAEVLRTTPDGDGALAVLRAGRMEEAEVTISALRPEPDTSVVAATHDATRAVPPPRASLELAGHGSIDFIPTNRDAAVHFGSPGQGLRFSLLPVEGVYATGAADGVSTLRGDPAAAGFAALRFAYRADGLPAALGDVDLGYAAEPVQRPVHAVSLPVSLGGAGPDDKPLVEMLCDDGAGHTQTVRPGVPVHLDFAARDGCRLVFHRERVGAEYGTQRLVLAVDVTRVDGGTRPEGHVSEPIVLRPGGETRVAWVKGVAAPFDRVSVRVGHSADESHYTTSEDSPSAPALQWAVIMGRSRARLYATTAIPTGMYRVSDRDHSGILTLNFGALGRLTWLDGEGQEGVVGLEAGVMGVGLANDMSSSGRSLTQVATVLGAGLGVPIANRGSIAETSINLHAWFEFEPSRAFGNGEGSPFGFVFGPSITIGNVGANL